MADPTIASATELHNTKERLIYHLIRTVAAGWKGKRDDEGCAALKYLKELGYPKDGDRWKFMYSSGEPGTHQKPSPEGRAKRAEEIEGALNGMLSTLSSLKKGGRLGHVEQIERAIDYGEKALWGDR